MNETLSFSQYLNGILWQLAIWFTGADADKDGDANVDAAADADVCVTVTQGLEGAIVAQKSACMNSSSGAVEADAGMADAAGMAVDIYRMGLSSPVPANRCRSLPDEDDDIGACIATDVAIRSKSHLTQRRKKPSSSSASSASSFSSSLLKHRGTLATVESHNKNRRRHHVSAKLAHHLRKQKQEGPRGIPCFDSKPPCSSLDCDDPTPCGKATVHRGAAGHRKTDVGDQGDGEAEAEIEAFDRTHPSSLPLLSPSSSTATIDCTSPCSPSACRF